MSYYYDSIDKVYTLDLPFNRISGTNILITGATGLIGSCLVDILMRNPNIDYHVYASYRNVENAKKRFAYYCEKDFFHTFYYDVTKHIETDIHFDYIFHTASFANPKMYAEHPVDVMKANIWGVTNLMEYGLSHGMKRLLYVSSGEVYGEGDGRVFTEGYSGYVNPVNPRSCYPASKRAAETLCVSYMQEFQADVVIARPCHIYGPNYLSSDNRVYAQFINNVIEGKDIIMKSTGEQYRSWCYVVDCASALLYILLKGENGEAYNVADPESNITIKQLAEMISGFCKKNVVIVAPQQNEAQGYNPVQKSIFSVDKICNLGWKTVGNMKEKIEQTIEDRRLFV